MRKEISHESSIQQRNQAVRCGNIQSAGECLLTFNQEIGIALRLQFQGGRQILRLHPAQNKTGLICPWLIGNNHAGKNLSVGRGGIRRMKVTSSR